MAPRNNGRARRRFKGAAAGRRHDHVRGGGRSFARDAEHSDQVITIHTILTILTIVGSSVADPISARDAVDLRANDDDRI